MPKIINWPLEARISFIAFIASFLSSFTLFHFQNFISVGILWLIVYFGFICVLVTLLIALFLHSLFPHTSTLNSSTRDRGSTFSIGWRAGFLGCVFSMGLFLVFNGTETKWTPFGLYLCILAFFHWSEYFATAMTSWETISLDSFLLNHSKEYWAAAASSWLELLLEAYFVPIMKSFTVLTWIGVAMCIVGEVLRKLAMITAGRNFTHLIQYKKRQHHELVTHGVYSLFRHPSYVGWFWWSVGTQVTVCNPVCTVLYTIVSWRFFEDRIYNEEITLINFFGEDYVNYQKRVPTGLPGIVGYQPVD